MRKLVYMSTTPIRWLTDDEERAWRDFRRLTIFVASATSADLAREGLSEADYEVLSTLSEQPGSRSPLGVQATKMGWSRSRLSRHAARMEERGLIARLDDPDDGRGCVLMLTEFGIDTVAAAAPAHLESVRSHFVDHLSAADLRALSRITAKVVDRQGR